MTRPAISLLAVLALAALTSACGHNMEQRAASGAIAGAVVAGPVGAVVGAGAGAVVDTASKPAPKKRR
ncbi:hypothetical protein [Caulobacter hibisci]|uniref:Glycine zipper domain-containing protein n=1 Tax=Caulobacter hibisci TaxID=2035993 RepID=A0ABS0SWW4_9CAUL|nr:hypothetical protein [Caulobacter hibisci]MBI1683909.1 hypothetical protein [Caulobacter hibisci]